MATFVLKDCRFYVDEFDLTTAANQHAVTFDRNLLPDTRMGQDSHTYVPGLGMSSFNHQGFVDPTIDPDAALWQNDTVIVTVTSDSDGSSEGDIIYSVSGIQGSNTPFGGSVGDLPGWTFNGQGVAPTIRGVMLHPKTARTSTSTTTGVQAGAIAAGQVGYAALHVFSGTASTLDVVIQSDTVGFPSPTSRITFAQATGATSEWATVAGAVTDDYWRVSYTVGGGTWTFAVTFGIA